MVACSAVHCDTRGSSSGAVCPYFLQVAFLVAGGSLSVSHHHCIGRIENRMRGFMTDGEALPIHVFLKIHQDAMSGDGVLDVQTGDIGIREPPSEDVQAYAPKIFIHVSRNRVSSVAQQRPQSPCRRLPVSFVTSTLRREGKWLLRYPQLGFKGGFDLTKEEKLLYRPPILRGEGIPMAPVEYAGLLKGCRASVVQKIPEIVPVEIGENQDFITRGPRLPRLNHGDAIRRDPCRCAHHFERKRLEFPRFHEFPRNGLVIKSHYLPLVKRGCVAGIVHSALFSVRRYFCRRLLGFSGRVYSIRPASIRSAMACLAAPETDLWPSACAISARPKGTRAIAAIIR